MLTNSQNTIILSANTAWFLLHFEGGLIKELLSLDYSVHCIAPYDKDIFTKLEELACTCHSIHINRKGMNPIEDAYTLMQYARLLHKVQPDALLNFTIKPVIYASIASRLLGIPTINTITGLGTVFIAGGTREWLVKKLYKLSQKKVSKIFILNKEDKELFENARLCKQSTLTLVPGAGVDIHTFKYTPLSQSNTLHFLFIGRILKDKGVREFINAARAVSNRNNSTRFTLLGPIDTESKSAISKKELEKLIGNNPAIHYAGTTDNVYSYIQNTHCVVLPSYREGVPTVLLEALAVGRPIITTNAPGCNAVVDDGVNGYIVPIKNADALANAMENIASATYDTLQAMGKAGRIKAEEKFSEEIVIAQYMREIDAVLNNSTKQHTA